MPRFVTVRSCRSQGEAAIFASVLTSAGIDATLDNEFAASIAGGEALPIINVQVPEEDAAQAFEILENHSE